MLKRIENFGEANGYFIFDSLTKVSDQTCICDNLIIIDFDKTKEKIIEETNQSTRSSCDGLNLKESIDFIEFKSFKNVKTKFHNKENMEKKEKNFIDKTEASLADKIESSIWMFEYILGHKNFSATKDEKTLYRNKIKNYYLVVDIDLTKNSKDTLVAKLNGLTLPTSLYDNLIIQVESILNDIDKYIKINKPKMISCEELKKFYTT
ncbi:MAG: hypothetical protein K0U38_01765 [Epsilonproteobacteria bacterium]|nr:hypothetical protein [Campylobacterota bacterium]